MDSFINKETETYFNFRKELEKYEKQGVNITIEGTPSSSVEVARVCMLRENSNYMRDYITDENGRLIELNFNQINTM